MILSCSKCFFFFFNDTATTEIYTLSLHDALPISQGRARCDCASSHAVYVIPTPQLSKDSFQALAAVSRSEEHTSELQSLAYLVCRLLLEKKKKIKLTLAYTCTQSDHIRSTPS